MEAIGGFVSFALGMLFLAGMIHYTRSAAMRGDLERNVGIGIKTKVTRSSDAAWKAGHLAAGPWLMAAAWTGYLGGSVTAVLAFVQALSETVFPLALVIPGAALVAMVVLLVLGANRANQAGRGE